MAAFFCWIIGIIVLLSIIIGLFNKLTAGKDNSYTCLVGKTVIVTGANTGIGYATALEMAKRGARVILACRNKEKADEARKKIIEETDNQNIIVALVDLSSLESVRKFAKHINETEERLDILINNAGASWVGQSTTEDGLELTMHMNYFSPFLLTILLLNLLKKSAPSRIVNVSSKGADRRPKLDPTNLNEFVSELTNYANSKLCNILFTKELAKRLSGSKVTVYSLHPGLIRTDIFRRMNTFYKFLIEVFTPIFFKNVEEGAQTQIYLSAAKGIEHLSGKHFEDCKVVDDYNSAKVPGLSEKVWNETVRLLKLQENEKNLLP